ncbi:M48 family metalloprotease [Microbispora hainanensis]|uniref:M48 family metalloprotease n=1 Tax=Microbispora hainanensis TaxID=568844 RepID=A0A544Z1S0_9ACTN|nr:M48 family metalloprotease [Microbispora hainanensis]TQS22955.1 M48 family metalloprotease [Microbispora hainanensis]
MTAVEPGRARLDERILGAGTNSRFALLLLLIVTAGGYMPMSVLSALRLGGYADCVLAAGIDYSAYTLTAATRLTGQALAFFPCAARHAPPPPVWQILAGPAVVVATTAAATLLLPLWKQRRGRCIRLDRVPGGTEIAARVEELAAGRVARVPELFMAPATTSRSASVFGTDGRPRLLLNGGLVACRTADPRTFDAVVLHELAHVANRDLTITYATVALWRTFIVLIVIPYLLWWSGLWAIGIATGVGSTVAASVTHYLAVPVIIAVVVHFVRADVLRSRELYADLTAGRWGAPLEHVWAAPAAPVGPSASPAPPTPLTPLTSAAPVEPGAPHVPPAPAERGRLHRLASVLLDQVRTHPRREIRRAALDDPAPLFTVSSPLMFLIGAGATLMNFHLLGHVEPRVADLSDWLGQGLATVPAAVVAAAVTAVLWRAVVRAAVLGRPAPSGVRAGLWLGLGLICGSLVNGQTTGGTWLPGRVWVLTLVVAAAVAVTCWTSQCARLAATSWPGRSLRWPLALCLISGWLILSAWFCWWNFYGAMYAGGFWYDPEGLRWSTANWFPGAGTARPDTTAVMAPMIAVLRYAAYRPLTPAAAVVAWVTPFALWAAGTVRHGPGRLRSPYAALGSREATDTVAPVTRPVPALRQAVAPALVGAVIAAAGVAGIQAWLHTLHAAPGQRGGMYAFSYAIWSLWAIAAGTLVAALIAAASARFRLPAALVAAGAAAILGLAAATALISVDGCVQPLSVLNNSCAWRPAWRQLEAGNTFGLVAHSALLLAPVVAVAATALAALCRLAWSAIPNARVPASQPVAATARARPGRRYATALPAAGLPCAALATAAVLMAGDAEAQFSTQAQLTTVGAQATFQRTAGLPVLPASQDMRRRQVIAWYRLGGRYLLDHALRIGKSVTAVLDSAERDDLPEDTADVMVRMRPLCQAMINLASREPVYFQVPDPMAQKSWHRFGEDIRKAGPACVRAVDRADVDAFRVSVIGLMAGSISAMSTSAMIDLIIGDSADPVYKGEPAEPPQPRL